MHLFVEHFVKFEAVKHLPFVRRPVRQELVAVTSVFAFPFRNLGTSPNNTEKAHRVRVLLSEGTLH